MREIDQLNWPNRQFSRRLEAGGIRWHVQQAGSGPTLLLVHGAGASTHSWRDVLPLLARHYNVVAPDLPGHAFTAAVGPGQSSIAGMSRLLAALLGALGAVPEYCVGHSAGAAILCRMALDGLIAPRLIVGINGAFMPYGGVATLLYPGIARLLAGSSVFSRLTARHAGQPANVARIIAGTGSTLDATGIRLYSRLAGDARHVAGVLTMMANWDLGPLARDLSRLATPMALLAAQNDRAVPPRQALEVQRLAPTCTVHRLDGLGHLAHEEEPERVTREILQLCAAAPC